MDNLITYLKQIIPQLKNLRTNEIESYLVNAIFVSPYKRASLEQIYNVVQLDYYPGLFQLGERKNAPTFLLDEREVPFEKWLFLKFNAEVEQIYKNRNLADKIDNIGVETLIEFSIGVLYFKNKQGESLVDLIINQEYSDIFRRIVMILLTGNPLYIFNNHQSFNNLGKEITPQIIKNTKHYSLRQRLFQSIASGMLGMDIKESIVSTAPISLDSNLSLKESTASQIVDELYRYIDNTSKIGIDNYNEYYKEVILGHNIHVVWFTDDYIATIFEMKFIEEQMNVNKTLSFTLVPRYDSYSNDASYNDILELLELDELQELRKYYHTGKFNICRNGMDISTIDFFRMSSELYEIIYESDICVVSGARAYEMTQGLKKTVYYTGIAVCKSYTESRTGFSKNSGKLIFLRQDAGECSFNGFKDRSWRRIQDNNEIIPVAKFTAKEYYKDKYADKQTC